MSNESAGCETTDLLSRRLAWLVWGLPSALVIGGIFWETARPWLWVPALLAAGVGCLANAARCGRLHCYITGPLFLLGALATALSGLGVVAIVWQGVLVAMVAGTALGYMFEAVRGKYVASRLRDGGKSSNIA